MVVAVEKGGVERITRVSLQGKAAAGGIPVVDLRRGEVGGAMVRACEEVGFFKVVNHGVPVELMEWLEAETVGFFARPEEEKERAAGVAAPYGYGSRRIGCSGDVGWVEYLLMQLRGGVADGPVTALLHQHGAARLCAAMAEYTAAVRGLAVALLEEMGKALGLAAGDALSRMVADEESDSLFRLNHYPPCPAAGEEVTGFGEHTDPQIVSILRANETCGLQIALRDGSWVSVPPDHSSLFVNVGDSLEVLTNGRFRSVRHRVVLGEETRSRVSMIFFGGPPPGGRLAPLPLMVAGGQESLYREITWSEYKESSFRTRLADDRLLLFHR